MEDPVVKDLPRKIAIAEMMTPVTPERGLTFASRSCFHRLRSPLYTPLIQESINGIVFLVKALFSSLLRLRASIGSPIFRILIWSTTLNQICIKM